LIKRLSEKIDLRFVSSGELFEMYFDPEKLMYIITNLISNALKYTPTGGRIEVATSTRANGSKFSIQVKDTEIGIDN
jgi:signal transduction histidine kinase